VKEKKEELSLGAEVVKLLLPQRPPFLMVDRIEAFSADAPASIHCRRCLSSNEPIFAGHFPQLGVFPGALMLEGLCQSSQLLCTLLIYRQRLAEQGRDPAILLDALRNLELGFRLEPGFQEEAARQYLEETQQARKAGLGMTASTQMKFLHPVFAGEVVHYTSRLSRQMGEMWRYDVEAEVGGRIVAKGVVTSVVLEHNALTSLLGAL
jgi:3-hydroxyacyl-[acyl-carrier-protein] dehydratase